MYRTLALNIRSTVFWEELRAIIRQGGPTLLAQIASVGIAIVDTILLGHYGTVDLAAIAVASGLYISVIFALMGIVQSLGSIASHHIGAGDRKAAVAALWQCLWLSQLLGLIGGAILFFSTPVLAISKLEPAVEELVREVLQILALGMPAILANRTFAAFFIAIGRTRILMVISLSQLGLHTILAWSLVWGHLAWPPLGAVGCAISTAIMSVVYLFFAFLYVIRHASIREYAVIAEFDWPRWRAFGDFFRLGLPMGFSNFVEMTSSALISLLAAPLGATVVAGHRVAANLAALLYMVPVGIAAATLARVGRAAGARDWERSKQASLAGAGLAFMVSMTVGLVLVATSKDVAHLFSSNPAVLKVAVLLIPFVVFQQFFDSVQTVFAFSLRGLKITLIPMFAHILCFWGIGLAGGMWLAYREQVGIVGFWLAAVASSLVAALLFGTMLRQAFLQRLSEDRQRIFR